MFQKLTLIRKNRRKVLGLNERNLEYIREYNQRQAKAIADDKVLTKKVLADNGIPVPKKIKVIKNRAKLNTFDFNTLPNSFVIKPVHGVRGGGVEIFYNRTKDGLWIRSDKSRVSAEELKSLCIDILDGRYSLNNEVDSVLIEERVAPHNAFRYYTYKGAPDIRLIVFNKIPIMAMLRVPTEASKGKANLDQGAIGAGIDMAVGKTTTAIIGKAGVIEKVPHTKIPVSGLRIPFWDRILRYAIEASAVTELGFAAVDFLIDKEKGPVIVELNARAGLSIQLANQTGMRSRLKKASGIKVKSVKQGIRLAKDMFGGEIEEEIEEISGKQVIGLIENVTIIGKNGKKIEDIKAKIDTGADRTSIDETLLSDLGYKDAIDYFNSFSYEKYTTFAEVEAINADRRAKLASGEIEEHPDIKSRSVVKSSSGFTIRPILDIELNLSGIDFITNATAVQRKNLEYQVIIGKKDLNKFLIDPSKIKL